MSTPTAFVRTAPSRRSAHQTSLRSPRGTMMFRAISLCGGRRVAYSIGRSLAGEDHCWNQAFPHGRPRLLPQSTAAELVVIDLIAQHDPQPNAEFPGHRDSGFTDPLLLELSPKELTQRAIRADRVHGGLAPQIAQERIALLAQAP